MSPRRGLRVAFHGTSIMSEGGYVERLRLSLQLRWPSVDLDWDNRGAGGATSRQVLDEVNTAPGSDLAVVGVGINDVWRRFEDREEEAVDEQEYVRNLRGILAALKVSARKTLLLTETPMGWHPEVVAINAELEHYGSLARGVARTEGADVLDLRPRFLEVARQLTDGEPPSPSNPALWSDGVHLNDLGDTLAAQLVEARLQRTGVLAALLA